LKAGTTIFFGRRAEIFNLKRLLKEFKEDFPSFDLVNTFWRNIPKHMRVKSFEVTLQDKDIEHMKRRSQMCKDWLIEREQQEIKLINSREF